LKELDDIVQKEVASNKHRGLKGACMKVADRYCTADGTPLNWKSLYTIMKGLRPQKPPGNER
jgi:hypothetical protein